MTQQPQPKPRGAWTSQSGFIIAAIGSAVGVGNIWRFPGVAYENGGGAFMVPYLIALFCAGIPILFLDWATGHRFRGSAPLSLRRAAGKPGEVLGWFQVMICVFIAIYYTAVVAWTASYFVFSFNSAWEGSEDGETGTFFFSDYLKLSEPGFSLDFVPAVLIPLVIFWLVALFLMSRGVAKGVQTANMIGVPVLVVSFLALVIGSLFLPGAFDGIGALFTPNFEVLTDASVWIAAFGQIFFSLSIAFGIMITYSSYQRRRSNLTSSGLVVAFANSSFEILAGIGVFAALGFFAAQQQITVAEIEGIKGVSLAFVTFPAIVSQMPIPWLFGALFFGSLLVAALTSLLSILEVVFGAVQDKFQVNRGVASWAFGLPLAAISIVLFGTTSGLFVLDTMDNFVNNVGVVSSAVIASVLLLWVNRRGKEYANHMSAISTFKIGKIWWFFAGIFAPLAIGYMFVQSLIGLITDGYEGYPGWFVAVAGWGVVAVMLVVAFTLSFFKWRRDPKALTPWPPVEGQRPIAGAGGSAKAPSAEAAASQSEAAAQSKGVAQ